MQGDQLNIAVLFCYLGKSDLSSVHVYSSVQWTSHSLQDIRITRSCLTGQLVTGVGEKEKGTFLKLFFIKKNPNGH